MTRDDWHLIAYFVGLLLLGAIVSVAYEQALKRNGIHVRELAVSECVTPEQKPRVGRGAGS